MEGDSDIQMVDAPAPSPRPLGAYLSGLPQKSSTSIPAPGLEKYRRVNQLAFGSLRQTSICNNAYKPMRRASGFTPPSQQAKSRQTNAVPPNRGPNFFNTPKGSTANFKNPRIRALPYLLPSNTRRRLSPSEYRRPWRPRQINSNPDPWPVEETGHALNDIHVLQKKFRLQRAAAALSPDDRLKVQRIEAKRPAGKAGNFEESAPKRARITETQGAAVPSTPMQSPVRCMPGAFPELSEREHPPFRLQPHFLPAAKTAAVKNIAIAGMSIYARICRITGVVKGAQRALKQGIRASTHFATTVGRRVRAIHEPFSAVVIEERRETPETHESATSAASDQLQADLTAHAGHEIPAFDPSAQLQAELDYASHFSPLFTVVNAPELAPSMISANLLAQDQYPVQEEIMSDRSATLPEQPKSTASAASAGVEAQVASTSTVQSTSTSTSLEVEASVEEDEDPDRQTFRELFDKYRDRLGRPRVESHLYRRKYVNCHVERPAPVTSSKTSLDAEASNTELAQENEEDKNSVSTEEHPTFGAQDTAQVEEQRIEERHVGGQQTGEQVVDEQTFDMSPDPPDNDDEYDPDAYYPGVPPLCPERRFIFNAAFRRKAAAKAKAEREKAAAQKAKEAAQAPIREYFAAKEAFEAAKVKQAQDAARRSILKRRSGDNPNQRRLSATIQETVSQLAATTVHDEILEIPEVPRPTRHVHWPDEGTNFHIDFCVPSSSRWFYDNAPPIEFRKGPEPRDKAGFLEYQGDLQRQDEEWERRQREKVIKERAQAFGRVDVPEGESAVRPLTSEWQQRLAVAMRSSPRDVLAKTTDADLTHEKLETCWTRLAWLNDEVINGHLRHTVNYLRRQANNLGPNDAPKYHAFNSFFYKNLREGGYKKVARWANRVKIGGSALLNVETVFIPVHEGMHWTLLVVSPRLRTIEYFDSLGGNADSFVENIRRWLQGELGAAYKESEWLFLNTPSPQQNNGSDCGVFLLTSAKAIALGLKPTVYGPRDIELIRKKIVAELMNGGLQGEFDPRDSSGDIRL